MKLCAVEYDEDTNHITNVEWGDEFTSQGEDAQALMLRDLLVAVGLAYAYTVEKIMPSVRPSERTH